MKRMLAFGAAVVMCACRADGATTANQLPPSLAWSDAEKVLLRADEIKRLALGAGQAALADAFRGRALERLEAQAQTFGRRGLRDEERSLVRVLVFWDPHAEEAVLQVVAQRRLATPDQPDPRWAASVRQWWARLQYADSTWWVVDQRDLPPDQWHELRR